MEKITEKDRARLRALAVKQLEYANSERNAQIMKQWEALGAGRRENPTVRLLYSNFTNEVVTPRLECEGETARKLEAQFLSTLVGRELFDDDTPIAPTFDISWATWCKPFGTSHRITYAPGSNPKGFHIEPVIHDLEEESMALLRGGNFGVDREATQAKVELAGELFGDILPVRKVMGSLTGAITNPLVMLMSMESYYYAMYDYPDELHQVMDMATRVYED